MNFPVDFVDSCTEEVDKISGVSKTDYFPITSRSMKPYEKKKIMSSPKECVGVVPKQ